VNNLPIIQISQCHQPFRAAGAKNYSPLWHPDFPPVKKFVFLKNKKPPKRAAFAVA